MICFMNDTTTTEIYSLALHDALPISWRKDLEVLDNAVKLIAKILLLHSKELPPCLVAASPKAEDRKSTRLHSSHANLSYAVFCLKTKQNRFRCLSATRHLQYSKEK